MKSLKRDFSIFCRQSDLWKEVYAFLCFCLFVCGGLFSVCGWGLLMFFGFHFSFIIVIQNKRPKVHAVGKDAFSVYSTKYFFEVLHRLSVDQKSIIEKFGFGCLLCLSKTYLPSSFVRWLVSCVDTVCSEIIAGDKILHFSKDVFHYVLGLPNSGYHLVENSAGGLKFVMSLFNLTEPPHITFFGNKLNSKEPLTDKEVFVCFMQVAVSCFLCPSICDSVDTKYIEQLGYPERARRFDICSLVHSHLMHGVSKAVNYIKAKGRKPKFFELCSYVLAVSVLFSLFFLQRVM